MVEKPRPVLVSEQRIEEEPGELGRRGWIDHQFSGCLAQLNQVRALEPAQLYRTDGSPPVRGEFRVERRGSRVPRLAAGNVPLPGGGSPWRAANAA